MGDDLTQHLPEVDVGRVGRDGQPVLRAGLVGEHDVHLAWPGVAIVVE